MLCYEVAKDFAGPVATVIAAATAAWISFQIGRQQIKIGRSVADINATQANIALQKLKYDLFDKKYDVFQSAQSVLLYCIQLDASEVFLFQNISRHMAKLDEARLFFSDAVCLFCEQIQKGIDHWTINRKTVIQPDSYGGRSVYVDQSEEFINSCQYLQDLLNESFSIFAPELTQSINIKLPSTSLSV